MNEYRVAIIGAGISGLCAGIYLDRMGIGPFRIFEKAADVGGTWRDNSYPGVECDVPSHLYSYSFAPKADWSREFAPGGEIHGYLRDVADDFALRSRTSFNTAVRKAEFDGQRWRLELSDGEICLADAVISAMGGLHTPHMPDLPGLASFEGPAFHTARWPEGMDLSGKRVAMIGTGASAVQCGPEIARIARHLHVVQRSPVWVGPKSNPTYPADEIRVMQENPEALRARRWALWKGWESTGLEMITPGSSINRRAEARARKHIAAQVADPALRAALTPAYNFTCKRPTLSDDYYRMFNQQNVSLVQGGLKDVDRNGIILDSGQRIEVDAIVFATGFKSFDIRNEIDVRGLHGRSLADVWDERIRTYKTVMAPGMPNFFFLLGPNTAGLTSTYQMIEAACGYIVQALAHLADNGLAWMEPKEVEVDAFCADIQSAYAGTTQNKGCVSWWTDGAGYAHANWPRSSIAYRLMMQDFRPLHFNFDR